MTIIATSINMLLFCAESKGKSILGANYLLEELIIIKDWIILSSSHFFKEKNAEGNLAIGGGNLIWLCLKAHSNERLFNIAVKLLSTDIDAF